MSVLRGGAPPYPALYAQWEAGQWSVANLSFDDDRAHWITLTDRDSYRALFSMIHLGEQAVVDRLAPLIVAVQTPETKAVVAGQASDESRHLTFMDRFADEVLALGGTPAERLSRAREHTSEGFAVIFDEFLGSAAARLAASPDDLHARVRFVTCYHMLVEGAFGLTAQPMILTALERRGLFPGFRRGFDLVSRDEHRHMAIGVALLRDAVGQDASAADAIRASVLDLAASWERLTTPPDLEGFFSVLGTTQDEFAAQAFAGLGRRLASVGGGLESLVPA